MLGERIRQARQGQQRSLADVASKAKISVATLSRIETDKQSVDLGLFLLLARILQITPRELLGDDEEGDGRGHLDPLAHKIAALDATERTKLWRDLANEHRTKRARGRGSRMRSISHEVEELLAQIDYLREELESMRMSIKKKR